MTDINIQNMEEEAGRKMGNYNPGFMMMKMMIAHLLNASYMVETLIYELTPVCLYYHHTALITVIL